MAHSGELVPVMTADRDPAAAELKGSVETTELRSKDPQRLAPLSGGADQSAGLPDPSRFTLPTPSL